MRKLILLACFLTFGCAKYGVSGCAQQAVGDWAEVRVPAGCHVKQIAGEEHSGVIILCDDGRVYH
jgi:hypothetical protein